MVLICCSLLRRHVDTLASVLLSELHIGIVDTLASVLLSELHVGVVDTLASVLLALSLARRVASFRSAVSAARRALSLSLSLSLSLVFFEASALSALGLI